MRYQDLDKMTISTKRTLKNLRQALTDLLKVKSLEKISIQELCDITMISRGTFYNYFYDKYDLLNYEWEQVQLKIDPKFTHSNPESISYKEYIELFLKNLINYLSKERQSYQMIISNNADSIFSANMHDYIGTQILLRLNEAITENAKPQVPLELLATVYASTIITVGNWWLKSGEDYTENDVYKFFTAIIDDKNKLV